jgi:DNA-binding beta-propeller fold protein YncE
MKIDKTTPQPLDNHRLLLSLAFAWSVLCAAAPCTQAQRMPQDSWYLAKETPADVEVFFNWPSAISVDLAGNFYVADSSNNSIVVFDATGKLLRRWGNTLNWQDTLSNPRSVFVSPDGKKVYVAHYSNANNKYCVSVFDPQGKRQLRIDSPTSPADRQFGYNAHVVADANGNIYVADRDTARINVYDSSGTYLRGWGGYSSSSEDGKFYGIAGMVLTSSGDLAVLDNYWPHRIQIFKTDGTFLRKISLADLNLDLGSVWSLATDAAGNWYVGSYRWSSGTYIGAVTVVTNAGQLIRNISAPSADDPANFRSVYGLAIRNDLIYVLDANEHRVFVFKATDGLPLTTLGSLSSLNTTRGFGLAVDSSGNKFISDTTANKIRKLDANDALVRSFASKGAGDEQFDGLGDLALSPDGQRLYAIDQNNHRVQFFDKDGQFLGKFGTQGAGNGQFKFPSGIAVNADGRVYVSDRDNHRVQFFDKDGQFLGKFGQEGSFDGYFKSPRGLAVAPGSKVIVADFDNKRIQVFDKDGQFINKADFKALLDQGQFSASTNNMGPPSFDDGSSSYNKPEKIAAAADGTIYVFGRAYLRSYGNKSLFSDGYALAAADEHLKGLKSWFPKNVVTREQQWALWRESYDALGPVVATPQGDLVLANGDGIIRTFRRTFRTVLPDVANAIPLPRVLSQQRRPGTTFVDVEYTVADANDAAVEVRALAFKNGGDSLADLIPITSLAEGTSAKLGANIATGQTHKFTWNVGQDISSDFAELQIEMLAKDGRQLLNLDYIEIPASGSDPPLKISRSPSTDKDLLSVWYWLIAQRDAGFNFAGGIVTQTGVASASDGLTAEYFSNANFTGLIKQETGKVPFVETTWDYSNGNSVQKSNLPAGTKSVRWSGYLVLGSMEPGNYYLNLGSGGGLLTVWVNGLKQIDGQQWGSTISLGQIQSGSPIPLTIEFVLDQNNNWPSLTASLNKDYNYATQRTLQVADYRTIPGLLAGGVFTTKAGRDYLFAKMGLREATAAEVKRAKEAGTPDNIIQWDPPLQVGPDERPAKINPYGFDTGAQGTWVVPVANN